MPHELDDNRAIYAHSPAWHKLGVVNEKGWFTAEEALNVLTPNREKVRKAVAGFHVEGKWYEVEDINALVEKTDNSYRHLSYQSKSYGLVQIEDQFRFLDEVVGNIGGAHYEAAVRLRRGRQVVLSINTGQLILDPNGRADEIKKYIWGFNSFDSSWSFRVKMGNFRIECANMAAMALRGSGDQVVSGDWSTRHTGEIMTRTAAAQKTLGLWKEYNDVWIEQAETMIQTEMGDNLFTRIIEGLFEVNDGVIRERDRESIGKVRTIYELSPTCSSVIGTFWGGLQSVTEFSDWYTEARGGKASSADEIRLRRQLGVAGNDLKQRAWDVFYRTAVDRRPLVVRV